MRCENSWAVLVLVGTEKHTLGLCFLVTEDCSPDHLNSQSAFIFTRESFRFPKPACDLLAFHNLIALFWVLSGP